MCNFDEAWMGKCRKETVEGEHYCEEHLQVKCAVCGEQATHTCPEASSLVCGTPLCDKKECRDKHRCI